MSSEPWSDVAELTASGDLRSLHLEASAHKDRAKRLFRLRGETRRRTVTVTGPQLEACARRLVEMAEQDALADDLVSDTEPLLSAERDTRSEAAE